MDESLMILFFLCSLPLGGGIGLYLHSYLSAASNWQREQFAQAMLATILAHEEVERQAAQPRSSYKAVIGVRRPKRTTMRFTPPSV